MPGHQLSRAEYLLSATQSELESVEMKRLEEASNAQTELQDLAHALGLHEQFVALFRHKMFATAFEDLVKACGRSLE